MLVDGRVALVTGGARGIGRAIALVLAEEGAAVAVADLRPDAADTAAEVARLGRPATSVVVDVSDPAQVRAAAEEVRRRLGPVEVLVNNAGIVNNIAPIRRMTPEAWDHELRVNLSGAFHFIREVIGAMVERRWGRIVNLSSIAATGGLHNQAAYAASKAGLLGLTQTVTLEHARSGITCNAILPGLIATELVLGMPAEIRDATIAATPARRLGDPREVGHLVAFLASDRAAFVNGAAIPIDGGMRLNTGSLGSRKEVQSRRAGKPG